MENMGNVSGIDTCASERQKVGTTVAYYSEMKERNSDIEYQNSNICQEKNTFIKITQLEIMQSNANPPWIKLALLSFAFLGGMGYNLDNSTRSIYTGYATNSYATHSLLSTIQVVNAVIGVTSQIVFARLSDYFGRLKLLFTALILHIMGTIIESQAKNVQTYAAGSVFWFAGYTGISLMMLLIMSDFSTLKWRLLFQYAPSLPFVIITWVVGDIVNASNPVLKWSWDIGMWAFITPLSLLPLIILLSYIRFKSSKTEEWKALLNTESKNQRASDTLGNIFWHLDAIGLVLISVSLGCILVTLTLAGGVAEKWHDGRIIAVLVIGGFLFPVFLFYEKKYSRNPLLPMNKTKQRGIWAALCSSFSSSLIYMLIEDYLYPVLMVAMNQSAGSTSMIVWLPSFMSVAMSPLVAIGLAKFRRTKAFAVFGTCIYTVSTGLFYRYRAGEASRSGVIAASICVGLGSSFLNYTLMVSAQSLCTHEKMAAVTGLYMALSKVGQAVGASISGALWTQTMYTQIAKRFNDAALAVEAYSSPYTFIISYPWGTLERMALVSAYKYVQRLIMIVALAFTVPLFICVFFTVDRRLTSTIAASDTSDCSEGELDDDDPIWAWVKNKVKFPRSEHI